VTYTEIDLCVLALTVALDLAVLRTRLLMRRAFWVSYLIILCFQLLVDGILTGRHVVVYARADILGPRLAFAPVEDLLFGFSLVTQTLCWWVWWGRRGVQR
jgi:lycopene cyclase domain-containing protein